MCYDVEDSDMRTDIVWTELGNMCVHLCVFSGFSKAPHSPNMLLSVHFTKTEEVVHDLTQPARCRVVTPKYRSSTSMKTLKSLRKSQDVVVYAFNLDLSLIRHCVSYTRPCFFDSLLLVRTRQKLPRTRIRQRNQEQ